MTTYEWGSVQINEASIILSLFRRGSFRRHRANKCLLSGAATTHEFGGESHRSQSRHMCSVASRCMPSVTSVLSLMQSKQKAPAAWVPSMGAPQSAQRTVAAFLGAGVKWTGASTSMVGRIRGISQSRRGLVELK